MNLSGTTVITGLTLLDVHQSVSTFSPSYFNNGAGLVHLLQAINEKN